MSGSHLTDLLAQFSAPVRMLNNKQYMQHMYPSAYRLALRCKNKVLRICSNCTYRAVADMLMQRSSTLHCDLDSDRVHVRHIPI